MARPSRSSTHSSAITILSSDSETEGAGTGAKASGIGSPSTAPTSVRGGKGGKVELDSDVEDSEEGAQTPRCVSSSQLTSTSRVFADRVPSNSSRTTPRRSAAAAASKKLVLPTFELTDSDDEEVKVSKRAAKGKGRAIVESTASSDDGGSADEYDASSVQGEVEDEDELMLDDDEDAGVKKARELAQKLKSSLSKSTLDKGKGKAVDADDLARSVSRSLKGKGRARSPSFEVVIDERKPTRKEREARTPNSVKGKAKASKPRRVAPPSDSDSDSEGSVFAPSASARSDDEDDDDDWEAEAAEMDVDEEEASEAFELDESEEEEKPKKKKKEKAKAKAKKLKDEEEEERLLAEGGEGEDLNKKKKKEKVAPRKGAHISKEEKKALKKMSHVRPLRTLRPLGRRVDDRSAVRAHDVLFGEEPPGAQDVLVRPR